MKLQLQYLPNLPPDLQIVIAVVIIVLGFFLLLYIIDRVFEWMRLRKLAKHPELLKARAEAEALKQKTKFVPPELIPRTVKVLVLRSDQILEEMCRYDGEFVRCRKINMMFSVPTDYKPYLSLVNGRNFVATMVFDDKGRALKIQLNENSAEAVPSAPDPRIVESIFGRRLLQQVFTRAWHGVDIPSLVAGAGLGIMVLVFVIFFILPLIGIPVSIGRTPVEVKIVQHIANATHVLPPPGNFTIAP